MTKIEEVMESEKVRIVYKTQSGERVTELTTLSELPEVMETVWREGGKVRAVRRGD